jgi:hypothetical protein
MEALGYLVGFVLVGGMACGALAPFLWRRYPKNRRRGR